MTSKNDVFPFIGLNCLLGPHKSGKTELLSALQSYNSPPKQEYIDKAFEFLGFKCPISLIQELALVYSAPEDCTITFRNLGDGCHPLIIYQFLSEIDKLAEEKSLRIVFSTYNSKVIDYFREFPEEIFCMINKKPTSLNEIFSLEYLANFASLGLLYNRGHFGN